MPFGGQGNFSEWVHHTSFLGSEDNTHVHLASYNSTRISCIQWTVLLDHASDSRWDNKLFVYSCYGEVFAMMLVDSHSQHNLYCPCWFCSPFAVCQVDFYAIFISAFIASY